MAEEIGYENGRNSNFQGLITLTLTLDPAIRHSVVHHSSTSTYIPNFIQIEETFCGRTDVWTYGHFPPFIIRSTFGSRPKNYYPYFSNLCKDNQKNKTYNEWITMNIHVPLNVVKRQIFSDSVYKATYFMLCKSLNMCVTNKNNLWLLLASFCHKSIVLQCNMSVHLLIQ